MSVVFVATSTVFVLQTRPATRAHATLSIQQMHVTGHMSQHSSHTSVAKKSLVDTKKFQKNHSGATNRRVIVCTAARIAPHALLRRCTNTVATMRKITAKQTMA